jgi:putative peptidoglycan lipid II flippase
LAPVFERQGWPAIYALAFGVMGGGLLQLAVQLWALSRIGMLPRIGLTPSGWRSAWAHPQVGRVLRNMAPALLGVSVAQLSLLINTQIASHIAVGAVSWITYADRLMEFPTALLGVALGVVLTPQLSAAKARDDAQAYSGLLDWGLRLVVLLATPCAVALVVFAQPLVAVLYHYGRFEAVDVTKTALAVMGYGVGLLGIVGVKILAPGFFARQDVKTPVKIAVAVLIGTQVLNLLLVPLLGHAALALSIGLGAIANALWLLIGLRRLGVYRPEPGWAGFALRAVAASALLGAALHGAATRFDWITAQGQPLVRALTMAAVLAGVAVLYFGALKLMGLKLRQFSRRVP